ncbi:UNVERIFIED_CONTAM: hypothetical protein FKN15_016099 [Acipenser sinensis]
MVGIPQHFDQPTNSSLPSKKNNDGLKKNNKMASDPSDIIESSMMQTRQFFEHLFSHIKGMGLETAAKMTSMQNEFLTFTEEFKALRTDLTALRSSINQNKKTITSDRLESKMADLEDRARQNNLRLVGLKEGDKGSDPTEFLTKSLHLWFPSLSGRAIEIMRAHHIYPSQDKTRNKLCTLIFNLLKYSDRQAILHAARKDSSRSVPGNIRFFPDFSNFTAQRCKAFSHHIGFAPSRALQAFLLYLVGSQDSPRLCKSPLSFS